MRPRRLCFHNMLSGTLAPGKSPGLPTCGFLIWNEGSFWVSLQLWDPFSFTWWRATSWIKKVLPLNTCSGVNRSVTHEEKYWQMPHDFGRRWRTCLWLAGSEHRSLAEPIPASWVLVGCGAAFPPQTRKTPDLRFPPHMAAGAQVI